MNKMKGFLLKIHIQRSGIGTVSETVFGLILSAKKGAIGLMDQAVSPDIALLKISGGWPAN